MPFALPVHFPFCRAGWILLPAAFLLSAFYLSSPQPGTTPKKSAAAGPAAANDTLCVCVLNDNLPLSSKNADPKTGKRGIYVDIAAALAGQLGKKMTTYTELSPYFGRPARQGLLARHCDIQVGLPRTEGTWYIPRKVALTQSFLSVGYALVVPAGQQISRLADLRGKAVATQTGAPPVEALSQYEDIDLSFFLFPEQAMQALAKGEVQAAFIWGPSAGYLNKYTYGGRYRVIPTDYQWPVAVGVRAEDTALRDRLNALLGGMDGSVSGLARQYGLPAGQVLSVKPAKAE